MIKYFGVMERLRAGEDILDFIKAHNIDIVDIEENSGYRYQTVYDIIKGNTRDPRGKTKLAIERSLNALLKDRSADTQISIGVDKDGLFFQKKVANSTASENHTNVSDLGPDMQEIYDMLMDMPEERRNKYMKILKFMIGEDE